MNLVPVTTAPTEADLEARIHAVLRVAFPWVPPGSLKHQIKFTFKFGRKTVEVDGAAASQAQGRADILVFNGSTPLAVLELKREGLALSDDDRDQGLSYARMIDPRPPLVIVTNGADLRLFESHTGNAWQPATASETALAELVATAGKLATSELQRAVEVLMGPGSQVWVKAIRAATEETISEMTGRWEEFEKPFVDGFLISRDATAEALKNVRAGKRITIVEGAPLAGKSSVLREIAAGKAGAEDMAVLFVEADSHSGGIISMIAVLLGDALGWHISSDDTRAWLARLSRQEGPALVIAVDGIGVGRDEIRKDIEELTGDRYGDNLRLVLATDDTVTTRLTMNETGRKATRIGRRAAIVTLGVLTATEFRRAVNLLSDHRIGIMKGGQAANEYRIPWVLRSLGADITTSSQYANETLAAALPPLLGVELLKRVRERFDENNDIRHGYRALAEAVMADAADDSRLPATVLQSMETFMIRRKTLKDHLEFNELKELTSRGFAKETVSEDQEMVVVARLPELLASELAFLLAQELSPRITDPRSAAAWFVTACARLPLGDIIGACALFDFFAAGGSIPMSFITEMLSIKPQTQKLHPGMTFAMSFPGAGRVEFTVLDDGRAMMRSGGVQEIIDAEDLVDGDLYGEMDSWMILAHLAGFPFVGQTPDGVLAGRADPMLLTEIGTATMALRRPALQDESGLPMHHIEGHGSIVCHMAGIVEPITYSIYSFLRRDSAGVEDWLDEAIDRNSFPLLARIEIALVTLVDGGSPQLASWANEMLVTKIRPALGAFPGLH
ncbi:MAG: type I restriction enzyme HsdR N-terminal domain-containing protein [Alphaproteobacteria bacterium]|nr:type I restriction enzyme HsdR N-terminal domain-containing protein [Alphaproteobacteria bacterium]MBU0804989.1 type I restriction enzyme HsdR N-terminal domain-containing protein [Alphaproteobacteria bacterium]MBU0870488.1 type I restriction enzyme HsdR N-terminal domain-containing protein [Alphaproteobacteria bacterium]MBU1401837.1 type I restriction enzyme HsdR N-terminal domain-containing protein [Alphaproteobacteria bacterium]MBU1591746.1 type I restriction enzyme HsdR N-terminal domain